MKIQMTKEEAAELVRAGLESDQSPIILKHELTDVEIKVTQNGVTLLVGMDLTETDDDDDDDDV